MKALLILLLWFPLAVAAQIAQPTQEDPVANKRAVELAEKLRCLVCQNQTIAESNATLAVDLRGQIREQIAQGKSDREITGFMVERYGDFVLYQPLLKPITLLLWFGPLALLLIGLFVLTRYLRQRGQRIDQVPMTEDQQRQAQSLLGGGEGVRK